MRALVVSRRPLLAQSFAAALSGAATDGGLAVEARVATEVGPNERTWGPDVIVIEGIVSLSAALALLQELRGVLAPANILVIGANDDVASAYTAVVAGASGYLSRDTSPALFIATLRSMARGELGLPPVVAREVVERLRAALALPGGAAEPDERLRKRLTLREQEVFALVRQGKRSREIASDLRISEGTVYKHIQNVLSKLHVHNRAHAVVAIELRGATRPRDTRSHATLPS